jgi:hypothetical protein
MLESVMGQAAVLYVKGTLAQSALKEHAGGVGFIYEGQVN